MDESREFGVDYFSEAVARDGIEHVLDVEGDEGAGGEGAFFLGVRYVFFNSEAYGGLGEGDAVLDAEGVVIREYVGGEGVFHFVSDGLGGDASEGGGDSEWSEFRVVVGVFL